MKSFSQMLNETPISDDDFAKYSETGKDADGKYNAELTTSPIKKHMEKKFETIGFGSSRVVFQCSVPVRLFTKNHRKQFRINKAGFTQTAIKLATNPEGIQQNTAELKFWNELQHLRYAKYLCPVLDWSGNPLYKNNSQYTLDIDKYKLDVNFPEGDLKGALWVQMPLVQSGEENIEEFMDAFDRVFGSIHLPTSEWDLKELEIDDPSDLAGWDDEQGIQNLMCIIAPDIFPTMAAKIMKRRRELFDIGVISEEQEQAMQDLVELRTMWHMSDFGHTANWGLLKGNPVILDYGYNEETALIYHNREDVNFDVYVEPSGDVRIAYAEKEKNFNK